MIVINIGGHDMSGITRGSHVSTEYTGTKTIPKNQNRAYFFIVVTEGSVTIEFGGGGGKIPLAKGDHYEPRVAPISEIVITGTGAYVINQVG